jgi:hypothetical protein
LVGKVALGQVFLPVLWFFIVNTIPPLLHIHSFIIWWMDSKLVSGRNSTERERERGSLPLYQ